MRRHEERIDRLCKRYPQMKREDIEDIWEEAFEANIKLEDDECREAWNLAVERCNEDIDRTKADILEQLDAYRGMLEMQLGWLDQGEWEKPEVVK
jgi:DNA primase large subunit